MKSLFKIGNVTCGNQRTSSIINCIRTFSSHNEQKPPKVIFGVEIETSFVWPETKLGILGPKDPRFPLPGIVGVELPKSKTLTRDFDLLTMEQNHERQSNMLEQFLAINEQPKTGIEFGDVFGKFKYSAKECPYFIAKDLNKIFPNSVLSKRCLTMINVYLKENKYEDVDYANEFCDAASQICKSFHDFGFWADFIDPKAERVPFGLGVTDDTSYETETRYKRSTVKLQTHDGCTLIAHRRDHQFVGCMITTAPVHHPLILALNFNIFTSE